VQALERCALCKETIVYGAIGMFLARQIRNVQVHCPNPSCKRNISAAEYSEHTGLCVRVSCICGNEMTRNAFQNHLCASILYLSSAFGTCNSNVQRRILESKEEKETRHILSFGALCHENLYLETFERRDKHHIARSSILGTVELEIEEVLWVVPPVMAAVLLRIGENASHKMAPWTPLELLVIHFLLKEEKLISKADDTFVILPQNVSQYLCGDFLSYMNAHHEKTRTKCRRIRSLELSLASHFKRDKTLNVSPLSTFIQLHQEFAVARGNRYPLDRTQEEFQEAMNNLLFRSILRRKDDLVYEYVVR